MHSTNISMDEARSRLDELVPLFDGSARPVRVFALDGDRPHAAMIDSETDENGVPFLWVGYWATSPRVGVLPELEVISAVSREALLGRRRLEPIEVPVSSVSLRRKDGALVAMRPCASPGFSTAWMGEVDGATVALCARVPLDGNVVVAESAAVGGFVRMWRDMVEAARGGL